MMKKLLILGVGFGLAFSASAQGLTRNLEAAKAQRTKSGAVTNEVNLNRSANSTVKAVTTKKANRNAAISLVDLGSSTNAYGISVALNCVAADPASNTVVFAHRGNVSGNVSVLDYSTDGGATWSINQGPLNPTAASNRYPQITVENTANSTSPSDVRYALWTSTVQPGVLSNSYSGAGKVTDIAGTRTEGFSPFSGYIPSSLVKGKAGEVWATNVDVYPDASADTINVKLQHGVWDAGTNAYAWSEMNFVTPADFTFDSTSYINVESPIAFDPTGNIGWYAVVGDFVGDGDDVNRVYNVAFYKTTDGGATWAAPIFANINSFSNVVADLDPQLPEGTVATLLANESSYNMVVDKHGNPHFSAVVFGSPGATYSYYPGARKCLYDLTYNGTDFNAIFIDSILAISYSGSAVYISNDFAVGNFIRNQVSRNADGSKVIFSWSDSNIDLEDGLNKFPDLFLAGIDVDANTRTATKNVTEGTDIDATAYLANISPISLTNGTFTEVPAVVADITGPDTGPLSHKYIKGAGFENAEFSISLGVKANAKNNLFTVSQNYPNPVDKATAFDITLANNADVNVKVSNVLGQVMYTLTSKTLDAGTHRIDLATEGLTSGIYFYTVTAGGFQVTNKMIVK
jgi:hypothetical protein